MIPDPPREWVEKLGDLGQPKDRMAHLEIWYDPDCARWLLMECVPGDGCPELVAALRLNPDRTPFRRRQFDYWHAHAKVPTAFWIIQGEQGGHRLQYGEHEATLAQWYGGSREPPVPGSLPYAPFDERVLTALRGYDRVMSRFGSLAAAYEGNYQAAIEQMRREMLASTESITEAVSAAANDILASDIPRVDGPPPDFEHEYDQFIRTGVMNAPAGSLSPGPSVRIPTETIFTP